MWSGIWSLEMNLGVFAIAALAIGIAGTKLAGYADQFADRTGLGEALTGTLFLGLITALPGVAASVTAALEDRPAMAISNALGGIAVQTTFLAVADITYRKANLEHAAASVSNIMQTVVMILLMTLVLLTLNGPDVTVAHVHPGTGVLFIAAGLGFWLVYLTGERPMWKPTQTRQTVPDVPEPGAEDASLARLVAGMAIAGAVVLVSGAAAAHAASGLTEQTGISESVMGGLFLAFATSLPELVTTIAAIRRGALTLAVGDIVGGNFFDVLFVCLADLAYRKGSIYDAPGISQRESFITALAILVNVILLMGLIYRQRRGPANIGFESVFMLVVYIGGFLAMSLLM